ncbi:selenide, water dikinase SelD [Salinibaculum salinum]|uniref:selenide, water dikinase SelD n=1 Tax=Salinibaculum salinum TaxID=3131996 RepID=UPI0030EDB006
MGDNEDGPALTERVELHGCSCKVGQGELDDILTDAGLVADQPELLFGVGEDAAARQLRDDLALVQTVDFFTPIVDDPYDFGRVAACNAASDAFASGAVDDVSCLVVMALPRDLTDVAVDVLAGIVDALETMDGAVAGGHTTLNPWPIAGGAVTATAHPDDLLTTRAAAPGDRLYLTKPLGTQPAMGALRVKDGEFAATVRETAPRPVEAIAEDALAWMTTPNRTAAVAAREYASAATDVTGFGLAGQSSVLAENAGVGVALTHLPVIDGTPALSSLFGYGLASGESAETSGGLLLSVPSDHETDLQNALADAGVFHRNVGRVTDGTGVTLDDPTREEIRR